VGPLQAYFAVLTGDLTVTGELDGGTLTTGAAIVRTDYGSGFRDNMLTANIIDKGAALDSGPVRVKQLANAQIDGAPLRPMAWRSVLRRMPASSP
jgi:hypothetical protein